MDIKCMNYIDTILYILFTIVIIIIIAHYCINYT